MPSKAVYELDSVSSLSNTDLLPVQQGVARLKSATLTQLKESILASSAMTGLPTAPTAAYLTDTTQLATTSFVNYAAGLAAGFVAGADCTAALTALLARTGEWRIPPNTEASPYYISSAITATVANLKIEANGVYFKRLSSWQPGASEQVHFMKISGDRFGFDGAVFDMDGQNMTTLSSDQTTYRTAAMHLTSLTNSYVRITAKNVPGLGIYSNILTDTDVDITSEGCTGAAVHDNVTRGTFKCVAKDSTNRFNGMLTNVNPHVFDLRDSTGFNVPVCIVDGVVGKYNNTGYSAFYSGITMLNCSDFIMYCPQVYNMYNDEVDDADCLTLLAQSYPSERFVLISPRIISGCNLAIELMVVPGGWVASDIFVDGLYVQPRTSSNSQGVSIKAGGFEPTPNRSGRNSTFGRPCMINGAISQRMVGDSFRWRAGGAYASGTLLALGSTRFGHLISHQGLTSSSMGEAYVARAITDRTFYGLQARNCGNNGIAVNNGDRITIVNGVANGCGWNAETRERASGIGQPEFTDDEDETSSVTVNIINGDYTGTYLETKTDAISFVPGAASEVMADTPWPTQRTVRWKRQDMGEIGSMFRVRDVMGAGIDALCRVINLQGDTGVITYEALQELTGTHDFSSPTVTGTGTSYSTELVAGQKVWSKDGTYCVVDTVDSNTQFTVEATPPAFGGSFVGKVLERSLTTIPSWDDTSFRRTLTGTVSANNNSKNFTGTGTDFEAELGGPTYLLISGNYYTLRSVTSATAMSTMTGASGAISGATVYAIEADIETFNPQKYSIRFDDDVTTQLRIMDPITGGVIVSAVEVPTAKVAAPSRYMVSDFHDYSFSAATNADTITMPTGWRLLGASIRALSECSGPTTPTGLSLTYTNAANDVIETICTMSATGSVITAGTTATGARTAYEVADAGDKLRISREGGSGSWDDGQVVVNAIVETTIPAIPLPRNNQVS
jgi:hypothetical protein